MLAGEACLRRFCWDCGLTFMLPLSQRRQNKIFLTCNRLISGTQIKTLSICYARTVKDTTLLGDFHAFRPWTNLNPGSRLKLAFAIWVNHARHRGELFTRSFRERTPLNDRVCVCDPFSHQISSMSLVKHPFTVAVRFTSGHKRCPFSNLTRGKVRLVARDAASSLPVGMKIKNHLKHFLEAYQTITSYITSLARPWDLFAVFRVITWHQPSHSKNALFLLYMPLWYPPTNVIRPVVPANG